jgi:hypothetical protein
LASPIIKRSDRPAAFGRHFGTLDAAASWSLLAGRLTPLTPLNHLKQRIKQQP